MDTLIPTLRLAALLALAALAGPQAVLAQGGCYADYKASRDKPFELHYGVIELPAAACASPEAAWPVIAGRIGAEGWALLSVVSLFGAEGLEQRKERAATYFLAY